MPILPLFGHDALRARLEHAAREGTLPASLLLHGPAGVGKQRLALQLAQAVLCSDANSPCGNCQHCRYTLELTHPDLHWYFPRPRLKDADASAAEVEMDLGEGRRERAQRHGLYAPPSGTEGIYVATVRALVRRATLSPAMARRKVFIVGDAERMVAQEGADQAANAFLKLLEEPPDDSLIVLTSSEPGALLPTIRSRVICVRVAPVGESAVREFLAHEAVRERLTLGSGRSPSVDELATLAGGRAGRLLESAEDGEGAVAARRLLEAAEGRSRARLLRAGFVLGAAGARGSFASMLEHLTMQLHRRVRDAAERGDDARALGLSRAMLWVEEAKERAHGNVNPQLAGTRLLRQLAGALR